MMTHRIELFDCDDDDGCSLVELLFEGVFTRDSLYSVRFRFSKLVDGIKLVGVLWCFCFVLMCFGVIMRIDKGSFVLYSFTRLGDILIKHIVADELLEDL